MELGHSLVQAPRGASASASRRRGSGVTASPSRKVNGNATVGYASPQQQQQQQQEQEQEQEQQQTVLGRKLECSKRPALPRSSSFELQNLGVPQQVGCIGDRLSGEEVGGVVRSMHKIIVG